MNTTNNASSIRIGEKMCGWYWLRVMDQEHVLGCQTPLTFQKNEKSSTSSKKRMVQMYVHTLYGPERARFE